jgi:hypothetical protein
MSKRNKKTACLSGFLSLAPSIFHMRSAKLGPSLEAAIDVFEQAVRQRMGIDTHPLDFCYRMRVGVK